ncbi:MAG TPA: hypothetical protein VH163_03000, partial [Gemmatimonadales bacterium]|nr:hypothetical protein [Gemmatimonadales bacterium]
MRPWIVGIGVVGVLAACAHDAVAPNPPPRLILLDSLRDVNDTALPCCSAVAGALSFYYPSHHSDYVGTPGGDVPKACVIGVPNGVLVNDRTGLAVTTGGDTLPLFVCTTGEYRLAVRSTPSGPDSLLSAGYFSWTPDSLWQSASLILIDT